MGTSDTLLTSTNSLTPLLAQADTLLLEARFGASQLQLEHFVIGEGGDGHPWGMFQQALREINVRADSMRSLMHDIQVLQCEERRHRIRSEKYAFTRLQKIDREEAALKAERARNQIITLSNSYGDVQSELRFLIVQAHKLRDQLGALTDERVRELEEEYWLRRLQRVALASITLTGSIDQTILRLLMGHTPFSKKVINALPKLPEHVMRYIERDAENHPHAAIAGH